MSGSRHLSEPLSHYWGNELLLFIFPQGLQRSLKWNQFPLGIHHLSFFPNEFHKTGSNCEKCWGWAWGTLAAWERHPMEESNCSSEASTGSGFVFRGESFWRSGPEFGTVSFLSLCTKHSQAHYNQSKTMERNLFCRSFAWKGLYSAKSPWMGTPGAPWK